MSKIKTIYNFKNALKRHYLYLYSSEWFPFFTQLFFNWNLFLSHLFPLDLVYFYFHLNNNSFTYFYLLCVKQVRTLAYHPSLSPLFLFFPIGLMRLKLHEWVATTHKVGFASLCLFTWLINANLFCIIQQKS